jgi:hypothetical protein
MLYLEIIIVCPQIHTKHIKHCVGRTQSLLLPWLSITGQQTCFIEGNKHVTYMCKTLRLAQRYNCGFPSSGMRRNVIVWIVARCFEQLSWLLAWLDPSRWKQYALSKSRDALAHIIQRHIPEIVNLLFAPLLYGNLELRPKLRRNFIVNFQLR